METPSGVERGRLEGGETSLLVPVPKAVAVVVMKLELWMKWVPNSGYRTMKRTVIVIFLFEL